MTNFWQRTQLRRADDLIEGGGRRRKRCERNEAGKSAFLPVFQTFRDRWTLKIFGCSKVSRLWIIRNPVRYVLLGFFLDVEDKRDIITLPRGILRFITFIISMILLATKILWNFPKFPTSIDIYSNNFISSMILHVSGNFKLSTICNFSSLQRLSIIVSIISCKLPIAKIFFNMEFCNYLKLLSLG